MDDRVEQYEREHGFDGEALLAILEEALSTSPGKEGMTTTQMLMCLDWRDNTYRRKKLKNLLRELMEAGLIEVCEVEVQTVTGRTTIADGFKPTQKALGELDEPDRESSEGDSF